MSKDAAFTNNYIIKNQMGNFSAYTEYIDKVVPVDDVTVKFICRKPKANMLTIWVSIMPVHVWSKVSPNAAAKSFQNSPSGAAPGPVTGAVFKTVCGAVFPSWVGPTPMSLRHCFAGILLSACFPRLLATHWREAHLVLVCCPMRQLSLSLALCPTLPNGPQVVPRPLTGRPAGDARRRSL